MQFTGNTSKRQPRHLLMILIKLSLFIIAIFTVVILLNKIDFPSPNKEIEKFIPNENLKIVK